MRHLNRYTAAVATPVLLAVLALALAACGDADPEPTASMPGIPAAAESSDTPEEDWEACDHVADAWHAIADGTAEDGQDDLMKAYLAGSPEVRELLDQAAEGSPELVLAHCDVDVDL